MDERGYRVSQWDSLFSPGRTLSESLPATVKSVQLVIAVVTGDAKDANVLVAAGVATALKRRLLILAPNGVSSVPDVLQGAFIVPVDPLNQSALRFAVDQLLASGKVSSQSRRRPSTAAPDTLGPYADVLLGKLRDWSNAESIQPDSHRALESIVSEALEALHLSAVASPKEKDIGADFAVWDDGLEAFGNPILIEVKGNVRGPMLQQAQGRLFRQLERSNATFGLLLWGIGPHPVISRSFQRGLRHQVFSWSVERFIESLRTHRFSDVVLSLVSSAE
jgi:hypothetical protein